MTKARTLANLISDNAELADGQISVAEVVGAAPSANPTFTGNIDVGDDVKIRLGASDDLNIFHDGQHSYIQESGFGSLKLKGEDIRLEDDDGNNIIKATSTAAELYYSGAKKLETTSSGVSVTGQILGTSTSHDGGATFDSTGTTQLWLRDTDAGTNQKNWGFQISGGDLNIVRANDDRASGFVTPIYIQQAPANSLTISSSGSVGFGVADGDVTNDNTASRTYVGIIGTANRGRLNLGSTASNGADSGVLSFVNGTNEIGNINMETNSGSQTVGKMYITSTDLLTINSAGGVVFNDNSASVDFRIESNGNANMFLVDASANTIGIGTTQMNVVGNNAAGINFLSDGMVGISRAGIPLKINRTAEGGIIELYEAGTPRAQIDIHGDRLLLRSSGDTSGLRFDANGYTPFKNGSPADGTVDLGYGSGRFRDLYLSGGIQFDARSSKLDDYEEGTWTPVIGGSTATSGQVYAMQQGTYTKIGNTVHAHAYISFTSVGTVTGSYAYIMGLPFNVTNSSGAYPSVNIGYFAGLSQNVAFLTGYANKGSSFAYLTFRQGDGTSIQYLSPAGIGNSSIIFSISYNTAS